MDKLDAAFAELALQKQLATREQLDECLDIVDKARSIGAVTNLADTMVGKHYLGRAEADGLLAAVRSGDSPARPAAPKRTIAGYELLAKLGEGGMGVVYKARQPTMDRIVAIKVLRPSLSRNDAYLERFFREARAAATLNHPNIVQAIDAGFADGYHYLVMEFVDGSTLAHHLKQGPMAEADALVIVHQVAQALAHAQGHDIVHRDVKPENIMLASDGRAKLADLGLAKSTTADSAVTLEGNALGTPYYMSPEQARGEANLDTRSDIYSLGATLYHMLCGTVPFSGDTPAVVISKRLTEPAPLPQTLRRDLSPATCRIVRKMMAREAARRYQTADELLADVEAAIRGEVPAEPLAEEPAAPRARTGKAALIAGCIAGAVVIAALALALGLRSDLEKDAQAALARAEAYLEQNQADFDGAIERFLAVITQFDKTAAAGAAARTINDLSARKAGAAAERDLARLQSTCAGLVKDGKYVKAIELIQEYGVAHASEIERAEAAKLRKEVLDKASALCLQVLAKSDAAVNAADYARARAELKALDGVAITSIRKRVDQKLAEIDALEKQVETEARWNKTESTFAEHLKARDYEAAGKALDAAREFPGKLYGERIAALAKRLAEAREVEAGEAEARETARVEAVKRCAAAFEQRVQPLLAQRDYGAAGIAMDDLAAQDELKPAAEQIAQGREDIDRLAAFWADVQAHAAALKPGLDLNVDGTRLVFVKYEDNKIWCKSGAAETRVDLLKAKAGTILGLLGAKYPDGDDQALKCAAFMIYDKDADQPAAADLLAKVTQPGEALERYKKLSGAASDSEKLEAAAEAAFAKLEKLAATNAAAAKSGLADFRAKFGGTRFFNEHLFAFDRLRSGEKEDDKSGVLIDEDTDRAILGYWAMNSCKEGLTPDGAGKGTHGRVEDRTTFERGIRGGCVNVERGSVEIPYRSRFSPKGSFSVDFCLRINVMPNTSSCCLAGVGADRYGYIRDNNGFAVRLYGGNITMEIRPRRYSADDEELESVHVKVGKWYHVAAVLDTEGGRATVYVNGTESWTCRTTAEFDNSDAQAPLHIGGQAFARLRGCFDEFRLWAVALKPEQVVKLAHLYGLSSAEGETKDDKDRIAEAEERLAADVSLAQDDIPLHYAVVALLNQAEVSYQWDKSARAAGALADKKVKVSVDAMRASNALKQVLEPLELTYDVEQAGVLVRPLHGYDPADLEKPEAGSIEERLGEPVTLAVPYPAYRKDAPVHQIPVQYAVMEILKQVGAVFDAEASLRNAGNACNKIITPQIRNRPCREALDTIVKQGGISYRIEKNKVVLYAK